MKFDGTCVLRRKSHHRNFAFLKKTVGTQFENSMGKIMVSLKFILLYQHPATSNDQPYIILYGVLSSRKPPDFFAWSADNDVPDREIAWRRSGPGIWVHVLFWSRE